LVQRDGLSEEILQRADGFLKFPWWVLQKVWISPFQLRLLFKIWQID
jgi:hypothetical protein